MTSKLTRERLQEIAEDGFLKHGESKALARMALAAMDSEPVAEVVSIYGDPEAFGEREIRPLVGIQQMPYGTKLYRHAHPAPVVPEEKPIPNTLSMYAVDAVAAIAEVKGWNACRAAMLQAGNSPVNDVTAGKPLTIILPDISSKAFWSGSGKTEVFHPETYRRWVKEAIERGCIIACIDAEVK